MRPLREHRREFFAFQVLNACAQSNASAMGFVRNGSSELEQFFLRQQRFIAHLYKVANATSDFAGFYAVAASGIQ